MMCHRVLDISCAIVLLPLLVAVFPVMWLVSKAGRYQSVFFVQERVGHRGRLIRVPKFRSLEQSGGRRHTNWVLGAARKSGLDELPQLLLILRGDMSAVGPRPLVPGDLYRSDSDLDPVLRQAFIQRQSIKPGMTGISQISSLARSREGMLYWTNLRRDLWYVRHRTAWLELVVLLFTPIYALSMGRLRFPAPRGCSQLGLSSPLLRSMTDAPARLPARELALCGGPGRTAGGCGSVLHSGEK